MKKLESLKREAIACCEFRRHQMTRFKRSAWRPDEVAYSVCRKCDAQVTVDSDPPANGIDIGGDAVAVSCK